MPDTYERIHQQLQRDLEAMAYTRALNEGVLHEIVQLYDTARRIAMENPELAPQLQVAVQGGSADLRLMVERFARRPLPLPQRDVVDELFDWLKG